MNKQDENIIRRLDEQAMQKEEQFFTHIANRLNRPRVTEAPAHPFRGAPDFWLGYELSDEKRVELFMANWTSMGGHAERCKDENALRTYIENLATTMKAKYMLRFDHPLLNELRVEQNLPDVEMTVWNEQAQEDLLAKAAGADIGIAVVEYGIAHTGTVVAISGPAQGRSVSLLPTVFIAVLRASDMKTRMGEVMDDLTRRFGNKLPAGVHFISGPSRSADIENDLTIGVHGPGIVHALILDA
ncbi:LutC/YkgG family protein [Aneurinibacillus sp. REN35]|uniref:LutC/YkgG family protein n=1 Tax=Aneurinibacillus sp. REN35 TaxID=3237286 RepID=UPI0035273D9A